MEQYRQLSKKALIEEIEALKIQNNSYRNQSQAIFNSLEVPALILNDHLDILDCNALFSKEFGFNKQQLINFRFSDIVHPEQINSSGKEKDGLFKNHLHHLLEQQGSSNRQDIQLSLMNNSGAWHDYLIRVQSIQNDNHDPKAIQHHLLLKFYDLKINGTEGIQSGNGKNSSSLTQNAYANQETREQLNSLFEHANDLIFICDSEGNFLYTNKEWKKKLGYDEDSLHKFRFEDIIHPQYASHTKQYLKDILAGKPAGKLETVLLAKNGSYINASGSLSCRFHKGNPFELRGIFHDITNRLRAEKAQHLCYNIANIIIYSDDLDNFYKSIHEELKKVITAENFIIALKGDQGNLTYPYYVDKYPENIKNKRNNTFHANSLAAYTINQGRPIFLNANEISKLEKNGAINPLKKIPREWLGVPLKTKKETIGVIAVKSYSQQKSLTSHDLALLDFVSGQIAMILERKFIEDQVKQQTRRLNAIFESSSHVIFSLDKDFKFTAFNQNFANLIYEKYGVWPEKDKFNHELNKRIPDKNKKFWKGKYETAFAGHPLAFEVSTQINKKKKSWYSVYLNPIYDEHNNVLEISSISHDITDRKNYELALRENEEKFRNIFESFQDIYFRCSLNGKINMISPSVKELLGLQPLEVLGKNITNYYLYDKETKNLLRQLTRKKSIRNFEASVVRKDGTIIQCICNVRLIHYQDHPTEIEGVARDITELKNTNLALQEAKEVAENSLKVKEAFLANMSHEIRTPMNGMISMIDLLGETDLNSEQEEYYQVIKKSSDNLLEILNDILDLSKIEAGKMDLKYTTVGISGLLEKLSTLYSQQAALKGINFKYKVNQNVPEYLKIDETRLLQILSNLTSNALKFTNEGGEITINVGDLSLLPEGPKKQEMTRVGKNRRKNIIAITVHDTGIGISEEDQEKLFQTFSQADSSSQKAFAGTGLGLSIAKKLCQMMNGAIGVLSNPGQGSTFWFTFEALEGNYESVKPEEENQFSTPFAGHSPKILLVDDNKINRQVTRKILEKAGCEPFLLDSGSKAIEVMKEKDFDLVFMDIQMPHMDGLETTKRLRELKNVKLPPIIAMTAYSMKGDREKFLDEGMDDYISKPIRSNNLINKIREWVTEDAPGQNAHDKPREETGQEKIINPTVMNELKKYGGMELVHATLKDFQMETGELIQNCFQYKKIKDFENILSNLHTIKGNASTLGIDQLASKAAEIEEQLKNNKKIDLNKALIALNTHFKKFQKQLDKLTKEV